jgi:hypothetical protein
LADHLAFVERETMGLPADDPAQRAKVAQLLMGWFANSVDSWQHGASD